jgi:small subunit ribosomal protein S1
VDDLGNPIKLEPGMEHEFKIIKMNPAEKKVGLSIRAVGEEASRHEIENYKAPASSTPGSATIGELMSWKRGSGDRD